MLSTHQLQLQLHVLQTQPDDVVDNASGEFDPLGTLVTLLILAVCLYGARAAYARSRGASGMTRYALLGATVFAGGLGVLVAISLLLNLAAAVGLV